MEKSSTFNEISDSLKNNSDFKILCLYRYCCFSGSRCLVAMIDRAIVAAFECFATKCVLYSTLQRRTSNLVTHVNSLAVLNKRANSVKDGSFPENNQLLFEFGSPNIAKPFHPGKMFRQIWIQFCTRAEQNLFKPQ